MEFAVLIHVLPLVVRILGHEVTVAPHLGEKNPPIFDKDVGHRTINMSPCLKPVLCFSLLKRGRVRGCPAGARLLIFLMDSVDFLKGIPNTCVDWSSLVARRACRL